MSQCNNLHKIYMLSQCNNFKFGIFDICYLMKYLPFKFDDIFIRKQQLKIKNKLTGNSHTNPKGP